MRSLVWRVHGKAHVLFGPQGLAWLRDNLVDCREFRSAIEARYGAPAAATRAWGNGAARPARSAES
ncbi:MAG: hypothetical protein OJF55_002993 [Rhodanobacteraceae bacterium]|jgi:hypothetical protein|nr:MAG: hypothetical protein OJF55_002993 [Rhodanobacteraceae bacterium]